MPSSHSPSTHPAAGDSVRNALFGLFSWLLPLLLTIGVTPVVVRSLGAERFGLLALVLGAGGYALGLTPARALLRQLAAHRADDRMQLAGGLVATAMLLTLALGAALGLGLALSSGFLARSVLRLPGELRGVAAQALLIAALGVPLGMLGQLFAAVPLALRRIDLYTRWTTLLAILLVAGNCVLALAGFGVQALVGWNVATSAVGAGVYFKLTRRLLPRASPRGGLNPALARHLLHFSAAVLVYQTCGTLLLLFERFWIARELGSAEVAYFVVPMTIAVYLHAAVTSLTLALLPLATEASARADFAELRAVYTRASRYSAALIAWSVTAVSVAARPLLELWLDGSFAERSATVLVLQASAFGLVALAVVPWQMAEALDRPGLNAGLALAWLAVGGALVVALTPRYGIAGVATARLLAMVCLPFYFARVERLIFGRFLWRGWRRTLAWLLAAAALAGFVESSLLARLPTSWASLALAVGLGGLVFAGCLRLSGLLDTDDVAWLRRRLRAAWRSPRAAGAE